MNSTAGSVTRAVVQSEHRTNLGPVLEQQVCRIQLAVGKHGEGRPVAVFPNPCGPTLQQHVGDLEGPAYLREVGEPGAAHLRCVMYRDPGGPRRFRINGMQLVQSAAPVRRSRSGSPGQNARSARRFPGYRCQTGFTGQQRICNQRVTVDPPIGHAEHHPRSHELEDGGFFLDLRRNIRAPRNTKYPSMAGSVGCEDNLIIQTALH